MIAFARASPLLFLSVPSTRIFLPGSLDVVIVSAAVLQLLRIRFRKEVSGCSGKYFLSERIAETSGDDFKAVVASFNKVVVSVWAIQIPLISNERMVKVFFLQTVCRFYDC